MRILFTFAGGSGHLDPLVPIARAATAGGHEVAFAGRPRMVPVIEALGFPAHAAGSDAGLTPERLPLRALDPVREDDALRDGFARRIAASARRTSSRCAAGCGPTCSSATRPTSARSWWASASASRPRPF